MTSATRLAVFDCDGTLVDGQASICEAMEAAFAGADLPCPPRAQVRRIVGLSLPQALVRLAPEASEEQRAQIVGGYKSAFFNARTEGRLSEPLFEGMRDLLHRLHGDGWLLGVATGKSDRGLTSCLAGHAISELFVTLQTADRHPSKPHPAMLEAALFEAGVTASAAVMIGDTSFDMEMASAAGVHAIGVDWGYHAPEELLASGAAAVASDMAGLEALLQERPHG
jgi:phosphoglycolate phosphatase